MKRKLLLMSLVAFCCVLVSASPGLASSGQAVKPSISITNLHDGETIYGSSVTVQVAISNFHLVKPVLLAPSHWATIPLLPGNQGHIHYVLDSLANLVLTRDVVVQTSHAWTHVAPGKHTIIAYLATSQHARFPGTRVAMVHVIVAAAPKSAATGKSAAAPSIKITGLTAAVGTSGMSVRVRVAVSNFKLVKPILRPPAKWSTIPLLPGNQGHIHYVLDSIANFQLTRDVVPDIAHAWPNVSPGWHTITAYLANSRHQEFPGTQPSSARLYVPSMRRTVRIQSLPTTGGADEVRRSPWVIDLLVGLMLAVLAATGLTYSIRRRDSTR